MSREVSRRRVLKAAGGAAFIGVSAAALKLPFFSTESAAQTPETCPSVDKSDTEARLIVSNWQAYIDPPRQPGSTLNVFQERTGIQVTYTDDVTDNTEFFAKVVNQLGSCETVERDMFMLTDWMADRMIQLGWIQQLDHDNLPNVESNLIQNLRAPLWDPERDYSVPWQSGVTGVAYNAALVPEVKSFSELLTREDLNGRVTLLTEMRDTMGFMLKLVGADPDNFTETQWQNALDLLSEAIARGQIRAFTGNEYIRDLGAGNIVACEAWSGDVIQLQFENPDIKFVVPEEGISLWSDNMLVPNLAEHKTNAEAWMDYYYEPAVAAKLAAWVNFICPVEGAREEMEKIDPSLVDNPLIFPDEKFLSNTFDFMPLPETLAKRYERDWSNTIGG
jgi:spermidine/putrescine transport system substrate-binding protein